MKKQNKEYWEERSINRFLESEKNSKKYINKIQDIYDQANKNIQRDIENIYDNYAKEVGVDKQVLKQKLTKIETNKVWKLLSKLGLNKYVKDNYKARISRLEEIQAQVYAKAKSIYKDEKKLQDLSHKNTIKDNYYKTIYDTQIGTELGFNFNRLDEKTIDNMLNEKWTGKNYSERIWKNTDKLANNLATILGGALLSGQSIEKTSRQIRELFNTNKYNATRLIRNEMLHFHHEAEFEAYKEMGIDKYVVLATLDLKTCNDCQAFDMKVFDTKDRKVGINSPQFHVNCRCAEMPNVDNDVLKSLERRARNPITGENEVIKNMSYNEWIKQYNKKMLQAGSGKGTIKYKNTKIREIGKIDFNNENEINETIKYFKETMRNKSLEHSYIIEPTGKLYHLIGTDNSIDYPDWMHLENSIGIHNHPKHRTAYSFSWKDVDLFLRGKMQRFDGIDELYDYSLKRTNKTNYNVKQGDVHVDYKKYVYDMYDEVNNHNLNREKNGVNYIVKKLSKKYNIKYERKEL